MRSKKLAAAAAVLAACLAPSAIAQTRTTLTKPLAWTSADGGLHFNVPAGWIRNEPPKDSGLALAVSSPSETSGKGVNCTLTITVVAPAPSGVTQAAMNAALMSRASSMTSLDELRAANSGGIATVDGFLAMSPRILIALKANYLRNGQIYDVYLKCGGQHRGDLTMDDLTIARQLFDTISITP